jgi:hypothetical protein
VQSDISVYVPMRYAIAAAVPITAAAAAATNCSLTRLMLIQVTHTSLNGHEPPHTAVVADGILPLEPSEQQASAGQHAVLKPQLQPQPLPLLQQQQQDPSANDAQVQDQQQVDGAVLQEGQQQQCLGPAELCPLPPMTVTQTHTLQPPLKPPLKLQPLLPQPQQPESHSPPQSSQQPLAGSSAEQQPQQQPVLPHADGGAAATRPAPAQPARRLLNLADASDGASVLAANPEARRPERAIDSDVDSFMKNDCAADKWMVIELSQVWSPWLRSSSSRHRQHGEGKGQWPLYYVALLNRCAATMLHDSAYGERLACPVTPSI